MSTQGLSLSERIVEATKDAPTDEDAKRITERVLRDWFKKNSLFIEGREVIDPKGKTSISEEQKEGIALDKLTVELLSEIIDNVSSKFVKYKKEESEYFKGEKEYYMRLCLLSHIPTEG